MTMGELRERLAAEGLPADWTGNEAGSAWYITFLLGVGAWVAALLLICVLGIAGMLSEQHSRLAVGMVGMALAIGMRAGVANSGEFLQQLALAGLLACEGVLLSGLPYEDPWLWLMLAEGLLTIPLALYLDRAGRLLTAFLMGICLLGVLLVHRHSAIPLDIWALGLALLGGFCWMRQRQLLAGPLGDLQAPVGYASLFTLFGLLQFSYWDFFNQRHLGSTTTMLLTAAVLWMAARLQRELALPMSAGLLTLGSVLLLGLTTVSVPGVMAGVGGLMLGFAARDAVVQALAWAFLLFFGTTFYYELSMTLLEKSGVLMLSGGLFLLLWRLVRRA